MNDKKALHAIEMFKLVKANNLLPVKMEELMPLSFIGQAAVSFYRTKVKMMDQLKMTEEQRKVTLRDGQEAGEMLLDIEARIGELALKEEKVEQPRRPQGRFGKTGKPHKHERLGLTEKRMEQAQAIHKHPDVVARVKAQAKANDDIPTRTAVINEIRYKKEKERQAQVKEKTKSWREQLPTEVAEYLSALEWCIRKIPQKPPKQWKEEAFNYARGLAQIIIKRLEVFHG